MPRWALSFFKGRSRGTRLRTGPLNAAHNADVLGNEAVRNQGESDANRLMSRPSQHHMDADQPLGRPEMKEPYPAKERLSPRAGVKQAHKYRIHGVTLEHVAVPPGHQQVWSMHVPGSQSVD